MPLTATPYLIFDGTCRAAISFYHACLGGEIVAMMDHRGPEVAPHVPPEWADRIMHARLVCGSATIMASDARPGDTVSHGGFSVALGVDTPGEAERIFAALSEGGTVTMPIGPTFWAIRFGMCVDRFGVAWMVNCETPAA